LLPAYYTLRGRAYPKYRTLVEKSQNWSTEQLLEFQWGQARALIKHAFETVPFYQEKYRAAGISIEDIKSPSDIKKLPTLSREEVNANQEKLTSKTFHGKLLRHSTGGSSGVPTRFFITYESFDWRMAVSARAYSWTGCHLGDRTLYLWGGPAGSVPGLKQLKLDAYRYLRRETVFNTFAQNEKLWQEIYESALAFKPKLIVGFVSSLEEFCRFLREKGLTLKRPEAVIAAAETVSQTTRSLVAETLGASLFNTYGSREFMSIAAECGVHDGLHINVENLLVETEFSPEGGPSEILITDLHNFGMPFIRYRIGDIGLLSDGGACACGRGLPRIHSIEGRVLDVLRTEDGRVVPGELFPHLMKEVPEVLEFQAEQVDYSHIVLRMVLRDSLSDQSSYLLRNGFKKAFGPSMEIEFQVVNSISRRSSGKRQVTVGLKR
jgi:phenylacetate-CoA ligase